MKKGGRPEMRQSGPRRPTVRLMLLAFVLLFSFISPVSAEPALAGYSRETGYTYVRLGQYPQTAEGEVRPILWRVLSAGDGQCVLLSEYILFARCLHADLKDYRDGIKGDFAKTDLCAYLNGDFASAAFTEGELALLLPLGDYGKVFLPSAEDLENKDYGLGITLKDVKSKKKILKDPGLRAWGTEWAIRNNGFDPAVYTKPKQKLTGSSGKEMPLHELRLFVYSEQWANHSPYWTRDPSAEDGRQGRVIKARGSIGRLEAGRDNIGVRPMILLAEGGYEIVSGAGTTDDPFTLSQKAE